MATAAQIAELRIAINEPDNVAPYTDELLGQLIDEYGVEDAGYNIWVAKRNKAASLVDISEGGSSRKTSQVFTQFDAIVKSYGKGDDANAAKRAPRTREITR